MKTSITAAERHERIAAWLHGSAEHCLLLLPDVLDSPAAFARALGLADAQRCVLQGGVMRPSFAPHPDFVSCLRDHDIQDIVVVTATHQDGVGSSLLHTVEFLARQMTRLAEYRLSIVGAWMSPRVQLHGWLWDAQRGWLTPYARSTRDLSRQARIALPAEALEPERADPALAATWIAMPSPAHSLRRTGT